MPTSAYIHLLKHAAAILGGTEALCALLEVPERRLRYWLEGVVTPPEHVFLRLVDIVMDHDSTTGEGRCSCSTHSPCTGRVTTRDSSVLRLEPPR